MIQRFKDFMWMAFINGQSRPLPKFLVNDNGVQIPMPKFWQVMILPVLIVVFAAIFGAQAWWVLAPLVILLALAGLLWILIAAIPRL